MRARLCVIAFLLTTILAPGPITMSGDRPVRQWGVTYLSELTLVASTVAERPVVFVHDEAKMARGEPCTSVRVFDRQRGPAEEIVSFHCIPVPRGAVGQFTIRTRPHADGGAGCILTEYQFAGDTEGHRVPTQANAH